MFTMQEFEQAKLGGIEKSILFSMSRNPVSYSMAMMNNKDKGQHIEMMMYNRLLSSGFEAEYVGGRYDILLNKLFRVEVKCATARSDSGTYIIQKMKPEYFDILIMVFVAPDRQEIKWSTQENVYNWAKDKARGVEGYSIVFNSDIVNHNLVYSNGYQSFLNEYRWQNELCQEMFQAST